jgi:DeoR/GlpR family transcriptional regulator of sugar metabolism
MGATGVHPQEGLTTGDREEASVKRALHRRAAETVVLASTEKLMAASPYVIVPLDVASLVVVPDATPAKVARALRAGGVRVLRSSAVGRSVAGP